MVSKLLIPVGLGLSLVVVSGLVAYYLFKKEEEEEDNKRVKTSRVNVIEVSIPKSIVPALIGRGGSNIKEIEKLSGARVNVKEFSDKDHDVCVIRGRSDASQIAETLVHDFINQQPVIVEDSIDVPAWACGRIIGAQGENINSISHRSGAKVKVSSHSEKATERKVMFWGTREQIKLAKDLIENCVAQEKCRREIEQSKRSPRHVQTSSKSPSPTPSTPSDHAEDATGDSQHRHVKYKRPAPRNDAASAPSRSAAEMRATSQQTNTCTTENAQTQNRESVFVIVLKLKALYFGIITFTKKVVYRQQEAKQKAAAEEFTRTTPRETKQHISGKTRADRGEVNAPSLAPVFRVQDHINNALTEYLAVEAATKQVNLLQCQDIVRAFRDEQQLDLLLDKTEGAIYNNATHQVVKGEMTGSYMFAYNIHTEKFVPKDEDKSTTSNKICFAAPLNAPIVVTTKSTKIMLQDKIIERANTLEPSMSNGWYNWPVPKIIWVNGVPGCGKTTWVVNHFDGNHDVVATTTIEAAKELRQKLVDRLGDGVKHRVRTMASILANGFREKYYRLTVDEALMNHFGSIVMAARLAGAKEIVLIGDVNQLPFIDRENLFQLFYTGPNLIATISQELLCTHRNPMDVAFALSDIYPGIYSSKQMIHSLTVKRYTGAVISKTSANTLYLVHTQKEKSVLCSQGYGSGAGSRVLTIHEAQGLTWKRVVIINTKTRRIMLHDSVPHAVVAVSRHTDSCVYYTDHGDDAIACFATRAMKAVSIEIVLYNLKMAKQKRDHAVADTLLKIAKSVADIQNSFRIMVHKVWRGLSHIVRRALGQINRLIVYLETED